MFVRHSSEIHRALSLLAIACNRFVRRRSQSAEAVNCLIGCSFELKPLIFHTGNGTSFCLARHFGHQPEHLKPGLLSNGREPCFLYQAIVVDMLGVGAMEIAYAELKRFQEVDDNNRETLSLELSKSVGLGGG
uniref:Uncharacterized protein n=1 Tax=Cucumis melo TaxID=3656 RepID=A0A9I9EES1_CUCME